MQGDNVFPIHPLTLALAWVSRGVPAFPVEILEEDGRLQKRPLTPHGHHDASLDPDVVRDMFVQHFARRGGELAVGLLPGAGHLIVLDPDVKSDDRDGVRFADSLGIPNGWLVLTPSGGQHRYFAKPDPLARYSNTVPESWNGFIDIRVDHGWVVAPGTVTKWGAWRAVDPWPASGPPRAPQAVLDALTYASGQTGPSGTPAGRLTPERRTVVPAHTLAVLDWLVANHGAHNPLLITRDSDTNYVAVTRPGKRVGISATIGFADTGALHLYSSSWQIAGARQGETSYPIGRDTDTLGARPRAVQRGIFVKGPFRVEAMAKDIADEIPIARDDTDGSLWCYEGGVWQPITAGHNVVLTAMAHRLGDRYRPAHRLATVEFLKGVSPVIQPSVPNPRYLNVQNGMLDWRTGELFGHSPDYHSVNQLVPRWRPSAKCSQFDRWIAEVLPVDLVGDWLDEMLGYLVLSGNPLQKAILLLGRGRNGKGTFIRAIQALLGPSNFSSVALHDLVSNKFRAAAMYGKLANICGDLDGNRLESTAMFKMVTGGDAISAERKFGDAFTFTPTAVPLFSANAVFGTPDTSDGYMSRWIIVPFPNTFSVPDPTLESRIQAEAELEGVLVRAVRGLRRLMLRGSFDVPESVEAAKNQFARESDPIRSFLEDCTLREPMANVSRAEIWTLYTVWAKESGHSALARTKFYARLEEAGLRPKRIGNERMFGGVRAMMRVQHGSLEPIYT